MSNRSKGYFLTKLCVAAIGAFVLPQSFAYYPNAHSMLEALRPTAAANAPELNELIITLDALPTEQQRQWALSTLSPTNNLSVIAASESTNRQMIKQLNQRRYKLQPPDEGFNAGDEDIWDEIFNGDSGKPEQSTEEVSKEAKEAKSIDEKYDFSFAQEKEEAEPEQKDPNKGLWGMLLGSDAKQKDRDNRYGYDATMLGGIIGWDMLLGDRFTLGIAGGYQQADADSRGPSSSYIDTKRFNVSLYGFYTCPSTFYIMGLVTGAHNRYDSSRHIVVHPSPGTFGFVRTANADFKSWEVHGHLELGKTWKWGNVYPTPKLFTNYTHWDVGSYIENDALGLNLNVRSHNIDSYIVGGGLLLEYRNHFKRAIVIPYIQGYILHDFIQDKEVTVSNMLGGGFDFLTESFKPAGTTYEAGAGINVHSFKDIVFDLHYDFAARSRYHRHSVALKLRYEWA